MLIPTRDDAVVALLVICSGIGIIHCTLVVPLAVLALHRQSPDWRLLEYLGANSALEQRVIELSVGYFTADFVHFILFEPDLLMFFHHGQTARTGCDLDGSAAIVRTSP